MSLSITALPHWTPPDLSSLDFSSNCTHVRGFLKSWFDLTPYEDIDEMPGRGFNVTFWVPETLDARATETYFRQALPPNLQNTTSYGAILEWERILRNNYSETVAKFLDIAIQLNETEIDGLPLDVPYFDHVIYAPSRACRQEVCHLGFDWDKLGDINGPGVFIYYALLLVIGIVYSIMAMFDVCRNQKRPIRTHSQPPPREAPSSSKFGDFFRDLFTTGRNTFSGFSDSAAVYSLALPCAITYNHLKGGVRVSSRKDLVLELWVLVYALCVCVWFYRLGACIRRAQREKYEALYGAPYRKSRKRTLATGVVLGLSVLAFVFLIIFLALYGGSTPFKFEMFWDDFCEYGSFSIDNVRWAIGLLAGYCASRLVTSIIFVRRRVGKKREAGLRNRGNRPLRGRELVEFMGNLYREVRDTDKPYRWWMKTWGVLDVVLLMIGSGTILWYYFNYREKLSRSIGANIWRDGWGLGQILAVSSLLSIIIGFIHTFVGVRIVRQANTSQGHRG